MACASIGSSSAGMTPSYRKNSLTEVERVCRQYDIELQFVPHLIGLDAFKAKPNPATAGLKPSALVC